MKDIAIFTKLFDFRAGGTVRSIHNFINDIKKTNNTNIIINGNQFIDENYTLSNKNFIISSINVFKIIKNLNNEILILNGFFSIRSCLLPILFLKILGKKNQIFLYPRGQLLWGALNYKNLKKTFFIFWFSIFINSKYIYWVSSSKDERKQCLFFSKIKKKCIILP